MTLNQQIQNASTLYLITNIETFIVDTCALFLRQLYVYSNHAHYKRDKTAIYLCMLFNYAELNMKISDLNL